MLGSRYQQHLPHNYVLDLISMENKGPRNIWSLLSNTSENVIICIQAGESCDLLIPESHLHFFLYLACVWVSLSVTCASVLFSKILSLAKKVEYMKILQFGRYKTTKIYQLLSSFRLWPYFAQVSQVVHSSEIVQMQQVLVLKDLEYSWEGGKRLKKI